MYSKKSLYREYRPKNLDEVAGHENIKKILIEEIKTKTLPHALLFSGQRGTGKTSIAKIIAKIMNCENPQNYNPCDTCANCVSFNKGSHPDILEMDAASNNGVDEIRNIKLSVSTLPIIGKYKIYIIDEVHMLTNAAFNALLKTLEEPPKHVVFVLATTEFTKIPETITSRCQLFNFKAISKKALELKVQEICNNEGKEISKEALEEIYFMSDGSLRDALNYLEQTIAITTDVVSVEELKKIFYISTKEDKLNLLDDIFNKKSEKVVEFFEKSNDEGIDFQTLSLGIIEIIKEFIAYKITNNANLLKVITEENAKKFSWISLNELFIFVDNLVDVYTKTLNINVNYQYILINILKTISQISGKTDEISLNKNLNEQQTINEVQNNIDRYQSEPQIFSSKLIEQEPLVNSHESIDEIKKIIRNEEYESTPNKSENWETPEQVVSSREQTKVVENESFDVIETVNDYISPEPNPDEQKQIKIIEDEDIFVKQLKLMNQEFSGNGFSYRISTDEVLSVVATASKEDRLLVEDKFEKINSDATLQKSNTFLPFVNSKVKGANKEALIIVVEVPEVARWINWKLQNEEYRKSLENLFNFRKIFISIDKVQWQQLKKEFIFRKNQGTLPQTSLVINEEKFYKNLVHSLSHEDETTKEVISFFGEDIKLVD